MFGGEILDHFSSGIRVLSGSNVEKYAQYHFHRDSGAYMNTFNF